MRSFPFLNQILVIVIALVSMFEGVSQEQSPASKVEVEAQPEYQDKLYSLFKSRSSNPKYSRIAGDWRTHSFQNKWMVRLTMKPVQECRVEMGPYLSSYDLSVSAKIFGKETAHLKPCMGVGLFGRQGFYLRLNGGGDKLQIVQYKEVIKEVPFDWQSEKWTYIELRMFAAKDKTHWNLEGRAWYEGATRPAKPLVIHSAYPSELTHRLSGRAGLTGSPYNGEPIYYDEIEVNKVTRVKK